MAEIQGMGHSRKRGKTPRFLQGSGNYVDDVKLPGMLHLDIVRSPYAHAKITKIDTEKALAIPGVLAVITGETLKQYNVPLDADADERHADGAADRHGQVPVSGSGRRARHRRAIPPPMAWPPSRSSTSRCRWWSTRSRRSSRARPRCATTRTSNHIWHWEGGDKDAHRAGLRPGRGHRQAGHLHPPHPRRLHRDLRLRGQVGRRSTGT